MCKHYHVAAILASGRGVHPEEARKARATELFHMNSFFVDNTTLEFVDDVNEHVGIVHLQDMRCLCVGFSHGIKCICTQVAAMAAPTSHVTEVESLDNHTPADENVPSPREAVEEKIKMKMEDINRWMDNIEQYDLVKLTKTLEYVDQLHKVLFSKHKRITRKRRQVALHPYRRAIRMKKVAIAKARHSGDHIYATSIKKHSTYTKKNRKEDGAFKMTNRAKGAQRVSFKK